jgi:hypothetical protein
MSWPMRQRFDGLYSGIPTVAIRYGGFISLETLTVAEKSYTRSKVSIILEFRRGDTSTPSAIKVALGDNEYDSVRNEFKLHVFVSDHEIFQLCLTRKYETNIAIWRGGPNFNEQKQERQRKRKRG